MRISAVSIGRNPPKEINVIVEVPVGGEPIKYEMDKEAGTLVVDRFLYTSMRYPGNYGFIPNTLSDDGDPCDVLIANQRGIIPGAVVACRPVGVLKMQDEAGGDEKIIAVPVPRLTRRYENVFNYLDLPDITIQQIEHFFTHYKDLESEKWVKVMGWGNAVEAEQIILDSIERAKKQTKLSPGRLLKPSCTCPAFALIRRRRSASHTGSTDSGSAAQAARLPHASVRCRAAGNPSSGLISQTHDVPTSSATTSGTSDGIRAAIRLSAWSRTNSRIRPSYPLNCIYCINRSSTIVLAL